MTSKGVRGGINEVTSLLKIQSCSGNKDEGERWTEEMHIIKVHLQVSHTAFQITPTGITLFTSNTNVRLSEK